MIFASAQAPPNFQLTLSCSQHRILKHSNPSRRSSVPPAPARVHISTSTKNGRSPEILYSNTTDDCIDPRLLEPDSESVAAQGLQQGQTNAFGDQPLLQYQAQHPQALPQYPLPALPPLLQYQAQNPPALLPFLQYQAQNPPALPPFPAPPPHHLPATLAYNLQALPAIAPQAQVQPALVMAQPAPAMAQPAPAIVQPAPTMAQPALAIAQPALAIAQPAPALAQPALAITLGPIQPVFVGIGPHRPVPLHANQPAPQIIAPRASQNNTFLPADYRYSRCSSLHASELFGKAKGLLPGQDIWLQLPLPHLNITIDEHLVIDRATTNNGKNCLEFRRIDANNNGSDVVVMSGGVRRLVEEILERYYVGVSLGRTQVGYANLYVYAVTGRYLGTLEELRVRCCHRNGLAI